CDSGWRAVVEQAERLPAFPGQQETVSVVPQGLLDQRRRGRIVFDHEDGLRRLLVPCHQRAPSLRQTGICKAHDSCHARQARRLWELQTRIESASGLPRDCCDRNLSHPAARLSRRRNGNIMEKRRITTMAGQGRAALFYGPGKPFELKEYTVPEPEPGALVMKISVANVCGSD